jgi:D-alanyl-lipoteichoic acid acyltransferase DltB (MBOAT superfamily)
MKLMKPNHWIKSAWGRYLLNPYLLFLLVVICSVSVLTVIEGTRLQSTFFLPTRLIRTSLPSFLQQLPLTNYTYIVFLFLALGSFYLTPPKWRWLPLVVFNTYFIAGFGYETFIPLLLTTLVSFYAAMLISKQDHQKTKKLIMRMGNLVCIALLFTYKYSLPFSWTLYKLFNSPIINLLFPLGISFYTFQAIAYITDVYSGKRQVINNIGLYYSFLSFFPKFTAGPIERQPGAIESIITPSKLSFQGLQTGIIRIFWGIFKKMVLVNRMIHVGEALFSSPEKLSSLETWVSVLFYSLYIYIDFSAYCDIAIGSAQLFGIKLTENFNRPYFAKSIQDFWQRWHITLTSWLNDYIFQPLNFSSRRIRKRILTFAHIMIVFLISGIWHGATIPFLIWGALHGVYQIIGALLTPIRNKFSTFLGIEDHSFSWKFYRAISTFLAVTLAWVLFGAPTIETARIIYTNLLFQSELLYTFSALTFSITQTDLTVILIGLAILGMVEVVSRNRDLYKEFTDLHFPLKLSLFIALVLIIILFGEYQILIASNFMYDLF